MVIYINQTKTQRALLLIVMGETRFWSPLLIGCRLIHSLRASVTSSTDPAARTLTGRLLVAYLKEGIDTY